MLRVENKIYKCRNTVSSADKKHVEAKLIIFRKYENINGVVKKNSWFNLRNKVNLVALKFH